MNEYEVPNRERVSQILYAMTENEGYDILEAVMEFCIRNSLEVEDVIPLLERPVVEDIRAIAIEQRKVVNVSRTNNLLDLF